MTIREIIRAMENENWFLVSQKGSVRQYKHPENKGRRVTLAGDSSLALSPGAMALLGIQLH